MTSSLRITVIGSTRRATVVVPASEPFAVLLPDIVDCLSEHIPPGQGCVLATQLGELVPLGVPCGQSGVPDGATVRLVSPTQAPVPPVVVDVTDVVAEAADESEHLWRPEHTSVAASLACAAIIVAVGWPLMSAGTVWPAVMIAAGALAAAVGASVLADALPSAARIRPLLGVVGAGWAGVVGACGAVAAGWGVAAGVGLGLAVAVVAYGGLVSLRSQSTAPLSGMGVGGLWAVLVGALSVAGLPVVGVAAACAVACVVALGVAPTVALAAGGVTALDDAVMGGDHPDRGEVLAALDDAWWHMAWMVAPVGAAVAWSVWVMSASDNAWAWALAGVTVVAVALRARHVGSVVCVTALWVALVVAGVGAVVAAPWSLGVVVGVAVVALAAVIAVAVANPAPHARVVARRVGDAVESVALVALFPLALGVWGLYLVVMGVFAA